MVIFKTISRKNNNYYNTISIVKNLDSKIMKFKKKGLKY